VTHPPCPHCCGLIIQSGIDRVFYPPADRAFLMRWADKIATANQMFREAGVLAMEIASP
jgi:deoxycytidylate deaminase